MTLPCCLLQGNHAASVMDLRAVGGSDGHRVSVARLVLPSMDHASKGATGSASAAANGVVRPRSSGNTTSPARVSPLNLAPITGSRASTADVAGSKPQLLHRAHSSVPARRASLDNVNGGMRMSAPVHVDRFFLVDDKHGRPLEPGMVAHAVAGSPSPTNRRLRLQPSRSFRDVTHSEQALDSVQATRVPGSMHFKAATTPHPKHGPQSGKDEAVATPRTRLGQSALQVMVQERVKRRLLARLPPKMSFLQEGGAHIANSHNGTAPSGAGQRRGSTGVQPGDNDDSDVWQVGKSMRNLLSASQDGAAVEASNGAQTPSTASEATGAQPGQSAGERKVGTKASSHERNVSLFRLRVTRATQRVSWVRPLARKLTACGRSHKSAAAGSGQGSG